MTVLLPPPTIVMIVSVYVGAGAKNASMALSEFMTTVSGLAVPVASPPQWWKTYPLLGTGVRTTDSPSL